MSSHREALEIAKDPVADNTDVYAFVNPDPTIKTVILIANYIPLEGPAGGPNFYEFGNDVLYEIKVDNDGDGRPDVTYQFQFQTTLQNPDTFLYNTGPITSLDDPNWNIRQVYTVTKVTDAGTTTLGSNLTCPPCNVGVRSTPNYPALAQAAVHTLKSGETVFAGQRAEGFYVDLGSVFDLLDVRPFQDMHVIPLPVAPGVNGTNRLNVHSIAIEVPQTALTRDGSVPANQTDPRSVVGVWATASRQKVTMRDGGDGGNGGNGHDGEQTSHGPWVQVSRLGNPLFNEAIVPVGDKDRWNSLTPADDSQFLKYAQHPEVSTRLPKFYPSSFPHLATLNARNAVRADVVAILLTGIPTGFVPGVQNYTGPLIADMLRLNMAVPPKAFAAEIPLGIIGGDFAGFPNGRRVKDDVFTIELRVLAGLTYVLVDKTYAPDPAAAVFTDGLTTANVNAPYLPTFPYLGVPYDGFDNPSNPS